MVHILLPYISCEIANALRQIDPSLARASSGLAPLPWRTFRQVIPPLSMPGAPRVSCWSSCWRSLLHHAGQVVAAARDHPLSMLIAQQVDQLNWPMRDIVAVCWRLPWRSIAALLSPARHQQCLPDERAMTARADWRAPPAATVVGLILLLLAFPHRRRGRGVVLFGDLTSPSRRRPSVCAGTAPISQAGLAATDLAQPLGRRSTVVLATLLGTLAALGIARLPRALRVRGGRADSLAVDRAGVVRGDRHLLCLLAYGLVGSPMASAGAYLPRCSLSSVTSSSADLAASTPGWSRPPSARRHARRDVLPGDADP